MTSIVVKDTTDRDRLFALLSNRAMPFTVSIAQGANRSTEQNRLQRKWLGEISEQTGEDIEDIRAYCKAHFGVPILRQENDQFREKYDAIIRPLDVEAKLSLMKEPISFPVTSLMTVKQKTKFLDAMHRHFSELGVYLTNPEDRRAA